MPTTPTTVSTRKFHPVDLFLGFALLLAATVMVLGIGQFAGLNSMGAIHREFLLQEPKSHHCDERLALYHDQLPDGWIAQCVDEISVSGGGSAGASDRVVNGVAMPNLRLIEVRRGTWLTDLDRTILHELAHARVNATGLTKSPTWGTWEDVVAVASASSVGTGSQDLTAITADKAYYHSPSEVYAENFARCVRGDNEAGNFLLVDCGAVVAVDPGAFDDALVSYEDLVGEQGRVVVAREPFSPVVPWVEDATEKSHSLRALLAVVGPL